MKIKLVFFDCDGVLTHDGWSKLIEVVKISEELNEKHLRDHFEGKLTHQQWAKLTEKFYKESGLKADDLKKLYRKIKINPEAFGLIKYLHKKKVPVAIISFGLDYYVKKIAKELRIPVWRAYSSFVFDAKGNFKKIKLENNDKKEQAVREICDSFRIKPTETIFIGDSISDIGPFKLTKHGVLYQSKYEDQELKKYAWKKIKNLSEVKKLLD